MQISHRRENYHPGVHTPSMSYSVSPFLYTFLDNLRHFLIEKVSFIATKEKQPLNSPFEITNYTLSKTLL